MLISWLGVAGSIVLLSIGGEALVRYSIRLAAALNISPTVIGLTVVAFGTSAPELATAVIAALDNHSQLAVGNVVGSNIANIGFILGLTALVTPIAAERRFVRREILFLVATALALVASVAIGSIGRVAALVLFGALVLFLRMLLKDGKLEEEVDSTAASTTPWIALLGSLMGLVLLVGGARWLIVAATSIAEGFGISERVIGLTIVAFGTSVPELVASLIAAFKRQTGLILGNIVGSNIFNTLLILPSAILIRPVAIEPSAFGFDIAVMLGFTLLLPVVFLRKHRINRWEGALMFVGYVTYIWALAGQQLS